MLEQLSTLETLHMVAAAADAAKVRLTTVSRIDTLGTDIVTIHAPIGDHDQLTAMIAEYDDMTVVSVVDRKRMKLTVVAATGASGVKRGKDVLAVMPISPRASLIDVIRTTKTAVDAHHAARAA
ncbi:hypothetical protein [Cereibacter azotoformans]|uniref:Uncharacterized protein n=1 Tax=Cereibacter azotoformans TaxID=43057 RepID=A0A2T5K713_9RHOB|nr:hypothetical protein [Cereibacter azotoformans]MBO4169538.1 hypothetical protein [Cereibacter azotoformans]PTR18215.1 hypothetical protein C8J28_109175 [Cereibacter azotoformans]